MNGRCTRCGAIGPVKEILLPTPIGVSPSFDIKTTVCTPSCERDRGPNVKRVG